MLNGACFCTLEHGNPSLSPYMPYHHAQGFCSILVLQGNAAGKYASQSFRASSASSSQGLLRLVSCLPCHAGHLFNLLYLNVLCRTVLRVISDQADHDEMAVLSGTAGLYPIKILIKNCI